MGQHFFVTTSIGSSWQVYGCEKLELKKVAQSSEKRILALETIRANTGPITVTAHEGFVHVWDSSGRIRESRMLASSSVLDMCAVGRSLFLVSTNGSLQSWDFDEQGNIIETRLVFETSGGKQPCSLLHPDTYVNKILVAFTDGSIELWNTRKCNCIYLYSFPVNISCMRNTSLLDVIAVGGQHGEIFIQNIKTDERIATLQQGTDEVTGMTFHSSEPLMVSAAKNGTLRVWNLLKGHVLACVEAAHQGSVHTLTFLGKSDIILTASEDNSIKQWVLEKQGTDLRHLKQRMGIQSESTFVRLFPEENALICGGMEAMNFVSLIRDEKNGALSCSCKENVTNKSSAIATRTAYHGNMLVSIGESNRVAVWNTEKKKLQSMVSLEMERDDEELSCCVITPCGTYALFGSNSGNIFKVNLQRCTVKRTHFQNHKTSSIVGLWVCSITEDVIAVHCDGKLVKFDKNGKQKAEMHLNASLLYVRSHTSNQLMAVVTSTLQVCLVETELLRVVRKFDKASKPIVDLSFSHNGHRIITAHPDGTLNIFDVMNGSLVHTYKTNLQITSIDATQIGDALVASVYDDNRVKYYLNQKAFVKQNAAEPEPNGLHTDVSGFRLANFKRNWSSAFQSLVRKDDVINRNKGEATGNENVPFFLDAFNPPVEENENSESDTKKPCSKGINFALQTCMYSFFQIFLTFLGQDIVLFFKECSSFEARMCLDESNEEMTDEVLQMCMDALCELSHDTEFDFEKIEGLIYLFLTNFEHRILAGNFQLKALRQLLSERREMWASMQALLDVNRSLISTIM